MSQYNNCLLCPRRCGVDRQAGQLGFCGETAALKLVFAGIHRGEEPALNGDGGSGTIFVSGCGLGCSFCQNHQISLKGMGRVVSTDEFVKICLAIQDMGAENVNIVTGNHAAPVIAQGIKAARKQGLFIPVVWNSSGYESIETLEILKDVVDIYLPDIKTLDSGFAARFFNAPDYPEHAIEAILKMMELKDLRFGPGRKEDGVDVLVSGVIIRHLVIPGFLENTRQVLHWFAENCQVASNHANSRRCAFLSLMTQYTPVNVPSVNKNPSGRFVLESEYDKLFSMLTEFGIDDGYCQELVTGSDWLPDFGRKNPFSSELSIPIWHWQETVL